MKGNLNAWISYCLKGFEHSIAYLARYQRLLCRSQEPVLY